MASLTAMPASLKLANFFLFRVRAGGVVAVISVTGEILPRMMRRRINKNLVQQTATFKLTPIIITSLTETCHFC